MNEEKPIGYIIGGGLKESLRARMIVPSQDALVQDKVEAWQAGSSAPIG